jgi:hypothetical protein
MDDSQSEFLLHRWFIAGTSAILRQFLAGSGQSSVFPPPAVGGFLLTSASGADVLLIPILFSCQYLA